MKDQLKIFEAILPRNPRKSELSHIFMDSQHIVSTDTTIMLRKKHDFEVEKSSLIINDTAKMAITAEGLFNGHAVNYSQASGYPDVARIYGKVNKQDHLHRAEHHDFINGLYVAAEEGHVIDFITYAPTLKKIAKALANEEVAEVRVGEDKPIYMRIGGYEFLFMPITFPKD